ncbi:MAG TPA: isochorismatase family cysteine hydrolase [Blastocatellia bacterium]
MAPLSINPTSSAVLSMDLQNGIISVYAKDDPKLPVRAAGVIKRSREAGAKVIHVKVGFRPGLPEICSRNQLFHSIKGSSRHQKLFEGDMGAIHQAVAPESGEVVVTKSRVNAFAGTDLELVLRAAQIDTLVLFGIATSGVVLSTLLHASDADYRLFVVKDCCVDADSSVHSCLIEKFFPSRATVLTSDETIAALHKGEG